MANLPKADELIGSTVTQQQFKTKLKQLVENIDRSYSTLAEANLDIANIGVGAKVDTDDSGRHYKATAGATSLTKSPYDPLVQAKDFVNASPTFKRKSITTENIKSITDDGDYSQSNKANAVPANGYPSEIEASDAGFLSVKSIFNGAGTISVYRLLEWRPRTTGTIFFCSYIYATNSWTDWIRVSTNADLEGLKSEILVDIGKVEDKIGKVEDKIVKPYDIITQSPNLFDKDSIQDNAYINNSGVIISSAGAAGWGMSDFIPVTAGEYYTISGTRGRNGVGFYSTKEQALTSSLSYVRTTTLPLTVQAPAGANFMLINVYAASTPAYSNIQVEHGSVATPYAPYGTLYEINPAYINGMGSNSKNRLEINGNIAKVYGEINGKSVVETIQLTKANTHSQSTVLNMVETSIDGVIHRAMTDDVAPLRADSTTIGANHGYAKVAVTSSAHGKTTADIGSVWSDGSYQWVIIDIVSANQIAVTARADNGGTLASNNITHVSGAVNISGFTATASTAGQWYQAFKNRKLNVSVDGVPVNIAEDGVHQFSKNVSFHESYEIMKKNDIVEWLVSNKGQDYQQYNADSSILLSQSYSYDKEIGCTIYSSIVALRSIPFVDYMATQAIPFNSGGGDVLYTVPKSTNFGELVNITTDPPSATVGFTASNLEAGATPVDRLIMLNNSAGFAVGYLPILSADPTERATIGRYGEIRVSSNKWYPRVAYNSAPATMNAGDHYEVIAYRKPFLKSAERTASYAVRSTQGDYLYLNWHTAKRDVIQLPDDLVGREFEIVEKSSNVTLLSKFAANSIVCDVGSSLPSGYLTLKFK